MKRDLELSIGAFSYMHYQAPVKGTRFRLIANDPALEGLPAEMADPIKKGVVRGNRYQGSWRQFLSGAGGQNNGEKCNKCAMHGVVVVCGRFVVKIVGGESEIRTHGTLTSSPV